MTDPLWMQLPACLESLKERPSWVYWQQKPGSGGRNRKLPYAPNGVRRLASVSDPGTWGSYREAVNRAPQDDERTGGIGFVLNDKDFAGVDLDDCLDAGAGTMEPWAQGIVTRAQNLSLYIEQSPSGTGLHIIGRMRGPKTSKTIRMRGGGHVEIYRGTSRYLTVTGMCMTDPPPRELGWIDPLIDWIDRMGGEDGDVDKSGSGLFYKAVTDLFEKGWKPARVLKDMEKHPHRYVSTSAGRYAGDGRLLAEIERAFTKWRGDQLEPVDWVICDTHTFVRGFVPPDYLIDGLIQRRFLYALTGRTGSGKSAVMLLLSILIGGIGARRIGIHEIERGRVLYLAGENPDDIRIRVVAMSEVMDFDPRQVDVHFIASVISLEDNLERLRKEAEKNGPYDLIVVDTGRAYFEGEDENDNVMMGRYARLLRQLTQLNGGPAVIVNCHPPKNVSNENLQPAGGGAFVAEVDGNLTITNVGENVELHWQTKLRGPEFSPLQFELRDVVSTRLRDIKGRRLRTVIARPVSEARAQLNESRDRQEQDAVMAIMHEQEEISLTAIADRLHWHTATGTPNRVKIFRITQALVRGGFVRKHRGRCILTKAGRIEVLKVRRRQRRALRR